MRRGVRIGIAVIAIIAASCAPTHRAAAPSVSLPEITTPRASSVTLAVMGPPLSVLGVIVRGSALSAAPRLYVSHDGTHFANVTPPLPGNDTKDRPWSFVSASFVDATHGWVLTEDAASGRLSQFVTADGGRTWHGSRLPASMSSSSGALTSMTAASIQMFDGQRGVLVTYGAKSTKIWTTDDGGSTWTTRFCPGPPSEQSCAEMPFDYAVEMHNTNQGYLAAGLPPRGYSLQAADLAGIFWQIRDTTPALVRVHAGLPSLVLARPRPVPTEIPVFGLPFFTGKHGIVPVAAVPNPLNDSPTPVKVTFYLTDNGSTWHAGPSVMGSADTAVAADLGPVLPMLPGVAIAGSTAWWVLSDSPGSYPRVSVTNNAGATWSTYPAHSMPSGWVVSFQARDAEHAWALIGTQTGGPMPASAPADPQLYSTSDGGRTWSAMTKAPG